MRPASPLIALALGAMLAVATTANAERVNGSYTTMTTRDAAACARVCADDGLCIAWVRHADGACELMAVAPSVAAEDGAAFGVATRAPAFAAWPAVRTTAAIEPVSLPAPAAPMVHRPETEATLALLGGPEDEMLRPRLGGQ